MLGTSVAEFAEIAATLAGLEEHLDVFLENGEEPLARELVLVEHLSAKFAPVHLAKPGKIQTSIEYNRSIRRNFRPNVTIARVLQWAVGEKGFNLDKPTADFQLKHQGQVLSLDDHLGQIAGGHKEVTLHLVFKVKPQG
jgi:hypothetical protein